MLTPFKIYKIEDSNASLYYEAELADFADVVVVFRLEFRVGFSVRCREDTVVNIILAAVP